MGCSFRAPHNARQQKERNSKSRAQHRRFTPHSVDVTQAQGAGPARPMPLFSSRPQSVRSLGVCWLRSGGGWRCPGEGESWRGGKGRSGGRPKGHS